jgi:hypothetical protein
MLRFLHSLFSSGELVLPRVESAFDVKSVRDALIQLEQHWRHELPGTSPTFLPDVSQKAAQVLMRLCRAVVDRDLGVEQAKLMIDQIGLSEDSSPEQHYSVDLVLRFLPQVADRARRISESDALLELMKKIGQQWPLSSVGMKDCAPDQLPAALQHPTLWRMYVDRIIAARDNSRVHNPLVRNAIAAALGPFENLEGWTFLSDDPATGTNAHPASTNL